MTKSNGIGSFLKHKGSIVESGVLAVGKHDVRINKYAEVTSHTDLNGNELPADKLPEYVDETPQLAVTFVGKNGVFTHRFNGVGFKRYDELSDDEKASGKFTEVRGYACVEDEGELVRIIDAERSRQAEEIFDRFLTAMGLKEGEVASDVLDRAIESKTELTIEIKAEMFDGKEHPELKSFRQVHAAAVEAKAEESAI